VALDDGFSWQGTHYRSLSAVARAITGTAWSGPLFFGIRQNQSTISRTQQALGLTGEAMESSGAAG
jgi:hypothetical protein